METFWSHLVVAYVVVGLLIVGLPMVLFVIMFMPGLMRTTGEGIGGDVGRAHDTVQPRPSNQPQPSKPLRSSLALRKASPKTKEPHPKVARTFANTP
jgi:hypothetical protein